MSKSQKIQITWSVDDVYSFRPDLTEEQAFEVLQNVKDSHDADIGVCWEARYLELINSYEKKQQPFFPEMLALLVAGLDEKVHTTGPEDILGAIYHDMEFHNVYKGQYFTPQHVSDMMAKISFREDDQTIKENGYISVCEPTCGSGVMITSFCKAMKDAGYNYCNQLVVTAIDIDIKCVHMAYLQLSLYGVPAVVIHGNSLTLESWSRWYTPVYMLNGWVYLKILARKSLNK